MEVIKTIKSKDDQMTVERLIALFYQKYPNMNYLIDAGANRGFHFTRMNKLPKLEYCIGIEANPEHVVKLETMTSNKSSVIGKALVGNNYNNNEICFKVNSEYHGRGGIKGSHIWELIKPDLEFTEIVVPTVQLDALIDNYFQYQLDFFKMDLEGAELGILLHSSKVYELNPIIVMENSVHGPTLNKITREDWIEFVESKNYFVVDFNFELCVPKTLFNYNHIFLIPKAKYKMARNIFFQCCRELGLN